MKLCFKRIPIPFSRWTIGWDLKNWALIQFTKTIPYTGNHRIVSCFIFYYAECEMCAGKTRVWLNIGINQPVLFIWLC